jgi:hypothetical protein
MATAVAVHSYTHSVTYVAENILRSFKDIIRLSGLDPGHLSDSWEVLHRGIRTWIESGHLDKVVLEVFDPATNVLVGRWDVRVVYEFTAGNGYFWTDTDAIRYAIQKAGTYPSLCRYAIKVTTKPGRRDVAGWSATTFRSTDGFVEQAVGTTVEHSGLSGGFSYYRRA